MPLDGGECLLSSRQQQSHFILPIQHCKYLYLTLLETSSTHQEQEHHASESSSSSHSAQKIAPNNQNSIDNYAQSIEELFTQNKENLQKKEKKTLLTNARTLTNFFGKTKDIYLKKNRVYLNQIRRKPIIMPIAKMLACLSLPRKTLFRFLELYSNEVTELTYLEKKMLAYVLKTAKFRREQTPCNTIWNLQF